MLARDIGLKEKTSQHFNPIHILRSLLCFIKFSVLLSLCKNKRPKNLSILIVSYTSLPKNFDGIGVKDNIFPHPVFHLINRKDSQSTSLLLYQQLFPDTAEY